MKKILAILLSAAMIVTMPAAVYADEAGTEQTVVQETASSDEEPAVVQEEQTAQAETDSDPEQDITLEASSTVKTLTTGVNNVTEPGDYQFTPPASGYYVKTSDFIYDEDGKEINAVGSIYIYYMNENNTSCTYLEKGKTYTINLIGDTYSKGTVTIDQVTNEYALGGHKVDMLASRREYCLISISQTDTFTFTSDTTGNLDCFIWSENGYLKPTSGTNNVDPDNGDYNFNASYTLSAGVYLLVVESKTKVAGTYTIIDSNHKHVTKTVAAVAATCTTAGHTAGTSCTECGMVISGQTTIPALGHSFTKYVYNNDATYSSDGTETATCDYGCGVSYTRTKSGTKLGLDAPVLKSIANTTTGVKVTWGAVSKAVKYRVYYRTETTGWKGVGNTTGTSYTITGLTSGTVYAVTVRCITADGKTFTSDIADMIGIIYLASVKPTVSNAATGVSVKWSQVTGATGYYVYRKTGSGSYSKITTIYSGSTVSWTDTSAVSGTTYTYAVRAIDDTEYGLFIGSYTGVSVYCLASIKPTVSNASSGIYVKWSKVTGANGYCVYRKSGSGSYTCIKTITSGSTVAYTDTTAVNGTLYTYAVRAYHGSTKGGFTAVSCLRLKAISLTSVAGGSGKFTAKWSAYSQATGYQIQYSTSSSFSGAKLLTVTGASTVSKTISSLTSGKTYYVRVRVYRNVSGVNYFSTWSAAKSVKVS